MHLYEEKQSSYYSDSRADLVELVVGAGLVVLDIGCGAGDMGKKLIELGKASWVSGVEIVRRQAEIAAAVLNEVIIGDISELELTWLHGRFDYIIAGDVLEHLADPWGVLKRLKPLLRDGGTLLVSIPNVRNWLILSQLILRGDWQYHKDGILDETHLRFFTRRSAIRLLHDSGYTVASVQPYFWGPKSRRCNSLTFGLFEEFLARNWLIVAHPCAEDQ